MAKLHYAFGKIWCFRCSVCLDAVSPGGTTTQRFGVVLGESSASCASGTRGSPEPLTCRRQVLAKRTQLDVYHFGKRRPGFFFVASFWKGSETSLLARTPPFTGTAFKMQMLHHSANRGSAMHQRSLARHISCGHGSLTQITPAHSSILPASFLLDLALVRTPL